MIKRFTLKSPTWRILIILLLGAIGLVCWTLFTPSSFRSLEDRLQNPTAEDVSYLVTYLKLNAEDPDLQVQICEAFTKLQSSSITAVPELIKLYEVSSDSSKIQNAVTESFRAIGVDALSKLLTSKDLTISLAAAKALVVLKNASVPELLKLLNEKATPTPIVAIWALGKIGPAASPAQKPLLSLLNEKQLLLRKNAIQALGLIGLAKESDIQQLAQGLQDREPDIRTETLYSLSRFEENARCIADRILPLLNDPDSTVQLTAAKALGLIRPTARHIALGLLDILKDEERDAELRKEVTRSLGRIGRHVEHLWRDALMHKDVKIRMTTVWALTQIGPEAESAIPALVQSLIDSEENVRVYATEALVKLGKPSVPPLINALNTDNIELRKSIVHTLGKLGTDGAKHLLPVLDDKENGVRLAAIDAIATLGQDGQLATNKLIAILNNPDIQIRKSVVLALAKIEVKTERVIMELTRSLREEEHKEVQLALMQALGSIGPQAESAVPVLVSRLREKDLELRLAALDALAEFKEAAKSAIPILVKLLGDTESELSNAASNTLSRIGKPSVDPLLAALSSKDKSVRKYAARSLGHLEPDAKVILPALLTLFDDEEPEVCVAALQAVANYGPVAASVIPKLEEMIKDESKKEISEQAKLTLEKVTPKTSEEESEPPQQENDRQSPRSS